MAVRADHPGVLPGALDWASGQRRLCPLEKGRRDVVPSGALYPWSDASCGRAVVEVRGLT